LPGRRPLRRAAKIGRPQLEPRSSVPDYDSPLPLCGIRVNRKRRRAGARQDAIAAAPVLVLLLVVVLDGQGAASAVGAARRPYLMEMNSEDHSSPITLEPHLPSPQTPNLPRLDLKSLATPALQLIEQGAAADSERPGGFGSIGTVLAKRLEDGFAFDFLQLW